MKLINSFLILQLFLYSKISWAHVKWFATNTTAQQPIPWSQLLQTPFWALLLLSLITIGGLVYLDQKIVNWAAYRRIDSYLAKYHDNALIILRVFTGASILLAWQSNSMIAPDIKILSDGIGWFEFFLALMLLTAITTPLAGAGMIILYFYAMKQYGFFHLLDYVVYPAIGYFLIVSSFKNEKIFNTRLPALYIGLGFSLCWVALEKLFFPHWGLNVLVQQPNLTMGLPADFFLMACAFVELSLGYLLIIGLLQRPLALTITLVFITTTLFFGKMEIIGHTILHGALLVFIVVGPGGYYPTPITFHKRLNWRVAFAVVNFLIITALLAVAYSKLSSEAAA